MGKILLSNSTTIFNKMHESYQKIGFRISFFESEEKRNISCYKKIYIDNENVWYAEDGTAVISVGTFIYKNEIGSKALNLFYRDFQKEGIEARKRADGIFALCIHNKNKDLIFTDIDGKGLYGIEAIYDEALQGIKGKKNTEIAKNYNVTEEEIMKEFGSKEVLKYNMAMEKAVEKKL